MNEINEGSVVIVQSGQIGTIVQLSGDAWVLLSNGNIWIGNANMMHVPQSQEEIDAALALDLDRFEGREKTGTKVRKPGGARYDD